MADQARVESVEILEELRPHLVKLADSLGSALNETLAEARKVQSWCENECAMGWANELNKRQEKLREAKDAYNSKKLSKGELSGRGSAQEEKAAMDEAQRRVDSARDRLANSKRWGRELETAIDSFIGGASAMGAMSEVELPKAVHSLDRAVQELRKYLRAQAEMELPDDTPDQEAS